MVEEMESKNYYHQKIKTNQQNIQKHLEIQDVSISGLLA